MDAFEKVIEINIWHYFLLMKAKTKKVWRTLEQNKRPY